MKRTWWMGAGALAAVLATAPPMRTYPLDGAAATGIRRLTGYRLIKEGKIKGSVVLPPGSLLPSDKIALHLKGAANYDITAGTPHDPYLQAGIERIFGHRDASYAVAMLDISDPAKPLYASYRGDDKKVPGSVGKLCIVTGLFGALAANWPAIPDRQRIMKDTIVEADSFIFTDSHTVPIYQDGDAAVVNRTFRIGDRMNLWEWADHMLSMSSNAAGSTLWKETLFMRKFGTAFPRPRAEEEAFLKTTPKPELSKMAMSALETALASSGIDTSKMRLGTFFTKTASNAIPGGGSYASPNELLRWLMKMEQGKLIDDWSSLEIKKLMYFVRSRYRYASAPSLTNAAVFFKSGSLFECKAGMTCKSYAGNQLNLMHSVAVVESGDKRYLVALMSNVLGTNSAVEHQVIAGEIEKMVQSRPK